MHITKDNVKDITGSAYISALKSIIITSGIGILDYKSNLIMSNNQLQPIPLELVICSFSLKTLPDHTALNTALEDVWNKRINHSLRFMPEREDSLVRKIYWKEKDLRYLWRLVPKRMVKKDEEGISFIFPIDIYVGILNKLKQNTGICLAANYVIKIKKVRDEIIKNSNGILIKRNIKKLEGRIHTSHLLKALQNPKKVDKILFKEILDFTIDKEEVYDILITEYSETGIIAEEFKTAVMLEINKLKEEYDK